MSEEEKFVLEISFEFRHFSQGRISTAPGGHYGVPGVGIVLVEHV